MMFQANSIADDDQDPPRPGVSATDVTSFVFG